MSRSHPLVVALAGAVAGGAFGAVWSPERELGLIPVLALTGGIAGLWSRRVAVRAARGDHAVLIGVFHGAMAGVVGQAIACWTIGLAIIGLMYFPLT
jgi:hypothetical protein